MTGAHTAAALHTLANGARVLHLPCPSAQTASISVFVRCGSGHESPRRNGIGHVIEHMAFKGTATRSARQINLDAERLGAEVNAHTDKDHTAFHMRGLAQHVPQLVAMLADIVREATFPEAEFVQEREVLLHEYTEDEDDPVSAAFKLFDRCAWGRHPLAQPVIGTRANIRRFSRADLVEHVAAHYDAANLVLAVAAPPEAQAALLRAAEAGFGSMPARTPNTLPAPAWVGGVRCQPMAGSSQSHLVLGFGVAPMQADDPAPALAAAVLGEGMSSPLLDTLREQRGLVYHASCSAALLDAGGQFIIEASTSPPQLAACLQALADLLARHARQVSDDDLQRAKNQLRVRRLRQAEKPGRRLEELALDVLLLGRLRDSDDWLARMQALDAARVQAVFEGMARAGAALAVTGRVPKGTQEVAQRALGAAGLVPG